MSRHFSKEEVQMAYREYENILNASDRQRKAKLQTEGPERRHSSKRRALDAVPEDPLSVPSTTLAGSQIPVTPAPGDPVLSSNLHRYLHAHLHAHAHVSTHTQKETLPPVRMAAIRNGSW